MLISPLTFEKFNKAGLLKLLEFGEYYQAYVLNPAVDIEYKPRKRLHGGFCNRYTYEPTASGVVSVTTMRSWNQ